MTTVPLPITARRVEVRWHAWAVAGVIALGVVLRFWGLGAHYLTYDEAFTALTARGSLSALIAATAGDVHPPLSYLVSWAVVHLFGLSPLTLRLPSAILGSLALPMALGLARRLKLSNAGELVGLALFAVSPFLVHYSQDARMYPLLHLAVLGALLAAWDRRYWRMAAWLTVAVWTHNYGLFYLLVIGLLAFWREAQRPVHAIADEGFPWTGPEDSARLRDVVQACALPVVLWLPWLGVLRSQMQTVAEGYWIMPLSLGQVIYPLFSLQWGVTMPATLTGPAAMVGYALMAFAAWKAWRLKTNRVLLWLVFGPFLIAGVVSLLWQPIYLFRAFIGASAPLALLIGWAVTERTQARLTLWAAAMVLPLLLLALVNRGPALATATGENSRALEVVTAGWQDGDIVYHGNVGSLSGFLITAPDYMPNYLMPVQPGSVGVLTAQTRAALAFCEGPLTPDYIRVECGGRLEFHQWKRAWLVWGASQTISGVEDAAVAALLAAYPNVQVLDIADVYRGPMPVDGGIWLLTQP